jgi:hypothetical protein
MDNPSPTLLRAMGWRAWHKRQRVKCEEWTTSIWLGFLTVKVLSKSTDPTLADYHRAMSDAYAKQIVALEAGADVARAEAEMDALAQCAREPTVKTACECIVSTLQ